MSDKIPSLGLIPVDRVLPSPHQARKYFSEEGIKSLADSIEKEGLLEPIMVRIVPAPNPLPEGVSVDEEWYELILGERRWRAHKQKGWKLIEAKVAVVDNPAAAASKSLVENLQREGINPIEEAEGFDHLNKLDPGYWTHEEIGKTVGKDRVYITQSIGILVLPQAIKDYVSRLTLTRSHAVELMRLPFPAIQEKAAKEIVAKDLNREATRQLIAKMLSTNDPTATPAQLKPAGFVLGKSGKCLHLAGDFPADIARADFMKAAGEVYQQWQAQKKASSKKSHLRQGSGRAQARGKAAEGRDDGQEATKAKLSVPQPDLNIYQKITIPTGLAGGDSIFQKCEAELRRMEQELQDPAKSEEEKVQIKAQLEQSKATFTQLKKEFGV